MPAQIISSEATSAASNQQLLADLEKLLAEHILELKARQNKSGDLRNEAAQHLIEYANHRCVAGEPKALGRLLIAGSELERLVTDAREPLYSFYEKIASAFDPEAMSMIKSCDEERGAVLILQEAVQELRRTVRAEVAARKASAEICASAQSRSSLVGRFLAVGAKLRVLTGGRK
jgi:hypothetical protein